MPKTTDPKDINAGTGRPEATKANYEINGSGGGTLVAPADAKNDYGISEGTLSPINSHVDDTQDAHAASAIQIDNKPDDIFTSQTVEGALDELSALIPPPTPTLGNYKNYQDLMGIPDWGILKLKDSSLTSRDPTSFLQDNPPGETYPYYWVPSHPAIEYKPFEPDGTIVYPTTNWNEGGNDPVTDSTFNVWNAGYLGGGDGWCHAGTFTEPVADVAVSTMRVFPWQGHVTLGISRYAIVSGVVYPSDRGVLALFYWPADGNLAAFLAQSLTTKCKAAILLGQGIYGCTSGCPRDGDVGGLFLKGSDSAGDYDPYEWPGQATGQASLEEIYTGLREDTGLAFAVSSPYYNFDGGLTVPGCKVADYDTFGGAPFPGQVRLGTDADAGVTPVSNGVPILGAIAAARGGGNDNNFLRYRLPYLDDYSSTSVGGLKYTPTTETDRYYMKPTISLAPGTDLTQAGDYVNYAKTYWPMQLARYRHQFLLESPAPVPATAGSYFMVHFRKEEYFEDFTLTGTVSADRIYSVNAADWTNMENASNVTDLSTPYDPAAFYHAIRSDLYADDAAAYTDPVAVGGDTYRVAVAAADETMFVSGIQYFLPQRWAGGAPAFSLLLCSADVTGFFGTIPDRNAYLIGDNVSYMYSTNPGSMCTGCLSQENNLVPTWGDPQRQRIEIPTFGPDGINQAAYPTTALGPVPGDPAALDIGPTTMDGDTDPCAFSSDVQPVAVWRRPMQQEQTATGIGLTTSIPEAGANTVLYHGTIDPTNTPLYGNFTVGSVPGTQIAGVAVPSLESGDKDVTERFLGEVYRYEGSWSGCTIPIATELISGAPTGVGIEVPVRAGTCVAFGGETWSDCSYLQSTNWVPPTYMGDHAATHTLEAQVAGFPHRNPPFTDGVYTPYPNAGRLMYPQTDYSAAHRPAAPADVAAAQLDYSVCVNDRHYVRAFDVGFARSTVPYQEVAGQSIFTIKLDGLALADFAYSGGANANVQIYAKIPGITAWLDLGRPDTATPGVDGNGCQVVGDDTFEDYDTQTGIIYSQVSVEMTNAFQLLTADTQRRVIVGPYTYWEFPVLIKVVLKFTPTASKYNFEWDFPALTAVDPTYSCAVVRGICGIRIVHPDE